MKNCEKPSSIVGTPYSAKCSFIFGFSDNFSFWCITKKSITRHVIKRLMAKRYRFSVIN